MKRIYIYILGLILSHTAAILCMDDATAAIKSQDNAGTEILSPRDKQILSSPPPTPKDCACLRFKLNKCRAHAKPFDDADYPATTSPKSTSPSTLSPKTIVANILANQPSDQTSQ